jgi:hypothetical protein
MQDDDNSQQIQYINMIKKKQAQFKKDFEAKLTEMNFKFDSQEQNS